MVEDIETSAVYIYEVDMSFILPFATIPSFASTNLANGQPAGTFEWSLSGGSPAFPGSASTIFARLLDDAFSPIDEESLPMTATSWTPKGNNFAGASGLRGVIFTSDEALDAISLVITDVRALGDGQPQLIFDQSTVRYSAYREANLTAVPEPASRLVAIIGISIVALRYRRSKQAH